MGSIQKPHHPSFFTLNLTPSIALHLSTFSLTVEVRLGHSRNPSCLSLHSKLNQTMHQMKYLLNLRKIFVFLSLKRSHSRLCCFVIWSMKDCLKFDLLDSNKISIFYQVNIFTNICLLLVYQSGSEDSFNAVKFSAQLG